MEKIQVTTSVTVFNQEMWFGISMGQSLIAINQVRSQGIQLSDNIYDQNRPLGIVYHDSDCYITFSVQQNVVGLETRAPTIKE